MSHVADLPTVALPPAFAEALLVDASCEAVMVEATGPGESIDTSDLTTTGAERRNSVTLFRAGRAYVAEITERGGPTRTVGLAPADARAYVERVDRDDAWTVLSVEGVLSAGNREAEDWAGTTAER